MTTVKGQMVRIEADPIRSIGRASQGVKVLSLKKEGDHIISVSRVMKVEDDDEEHISTGVYSVTNDSWKIEPGPQEQVFEIDEPNVRKKAASLMTQIELAEDEIEDDFSIDDDDDDKEDEGEYEELEEIDDLDDLGNIEEIDDLESDLDEDFNENEED